jgi:hypothetical protein
LVLAPAAAALGFGIMPTNDVNTDDFFIDRHDHCPRTGRPR